MNGSGLIGEYVVEIVEAAAATVISDASSAQFAEFARENPPFIALDAITSS